MINVTMTVVGDILHIECDLSKEFGRSSSGKTLVIASTQGNVPVPGSVAIVGLNLYKK